MKLEKAAEHLAAECNQKGRGWHAIMVQRRFEPVAPFRMVFEGIVIHILPGHESKWRSREQHFGFPVEVHPWPQEDLH